MTKRTQTMRTTQPSRPTFAAANAKIFVQDVGDYGKGKKPDPINVWLNTPVRNVNRAMVVVFLALCLLLGYGLGGQFNTKKTLETLNIVQQPQPTATLSCYTKAGSLRMDNVPNISIEAGVTVLCSNYSDSISMSFYKIPK